MRSHHRRRFYLKVYLTLAPIRTWNEICHRIIQFDNHVGTPNAFVDLLKKTTLFRVEISSIKLLLPCHIIHSAVLSNSPSDQSFTMARVTSQHTKHWTELEAFVENHNSIGRSNHGRRAPDKQARNFIEIVRLKRKGWTTGTRATRIRNT